MRYGAFLTLKLCLLLMACNTVPAYEEATGKGPMESQVLVRDIVGRVKCELANAFNDKLHERQFLWLQDWTVKSELTLSVSTQAGLIPSGGYTSYRRSAVNRAAGPSTFPGTALPTVPQFFNIGATAEYNEQALLTEVVDFTVSLKELQTLNPDSPACNPGGQTELLGNLGLRDWVNSVLVPVQEGYLTAGVHPAPGAGAGKQVSVPKLAFAITPFSFAPATCTKLKAELPKLQEAVDKVSSIKTSMSSAYSDLSKVDNTVTAAVGKYTNVLNDELKRKYSRFEIKKSDANSVKKSIEEIYETGSNLISDIGNSCSEDKAAGLKKLLDNFWNDLHREPDGSVLQSEINIFNQDLLSAANAIKGFPSHIDPPLDSLLHTVQFTVNYGAGVSPSWTLIQWKGPFANNASMASASGQRIHTLAITAGPVEGKVNQVQSDQLTRDVLRRVIITPTTVF